MISKQVKFNPEMVFEYCRQHGIKKLAVFGSAVHDNMRADSDLDILVEFKKPVGLFRLVRIETEMMSLFSGISKIDLVTKNALSEYFRDEVVREAEVVYAE